MGMHSFESCVSSALEGPLSGAEARPAVFLAAVSGGADSTALLAALAGLRKGSGFSLHCVHVEHGLRPPDESRGDAEAVEALCARLEVPCRVISVAQGRIAAFARSSGSGIEAAARHFRMRALYREARRVGADWALTAHTMDDALENLLMRIFRGSGPAGLCLMPCERKFGCLRGGLLRPILGLGRQNVLDYLNDNQLPYRTDSSNADIRFLRNRVRHRLIPLLDSSFPSWRPSLTALAETQSLVAEFLASETAKRLPWESCPARESGFFMKGSGAALRLREDAFLNAPQILREEAIFAGIDALAARWQGRPPRRSSVRRASARIGRWDLGPVRLCRQGAFIGMVPARRPCERGFALLIKGPGFYTLNGSISGFGKGLDLAIRAFDGEAQVFDQVETRDETGGAWESFRSGPFPLVFRNCREGDRIVRGGHRRGLSDIMGREFSGCAGVIAACDADGIAAFIAPGAGGRLAIAGRDTAGNGIPVSKGMPLIALSVSIVSGGADV